MANTNQVRGFVPVSDAYGAPYNGSVRAYYHAASDATPILIGDLVTETGVSEFVMQGGFKMSYSVVTRAATGDIFRGVCIGVLPQTQNDPIYAPASTGCVVLVADDPNALFLVQEQNTGTALTANDVGLNINVVVNAGSTVTGMSGMALNNGTEAVTNTLDLKIIGQYLAADNDLGADTSTGALPGRFLVRINRHRFANQVAGI